MELLVKGRKNTLFFVTAYILSAFGYEFIFFVMTVHIFNLTKSALNVSVFTALLVFTKIFLPFSGTITDRYKKENSFGIALLITGILVCFLFFIKNIYFIYALWFFISFFFTFIVNVRTALMTEIMNSGSYLKGNSTVFISLNIAKIASPLIGGILIAVFDAKILFLFTGIVYFFAFIVSKFILLPDEKPFNNKESKVLNQIKRALVFLHNNSDLKSLGLLLIARALFVGFQITLFVTYIKSYLHLGSSQYGFFLSVAAAGSIIGSFLGPVISRRINKFRIITIVLPLHYLTFILLGLNKNYYAALVIIFFSFIIFYIGAIAIHSIRDSSTDRKIRGTVYGTITALNAPVSAISMIFGGYCVNVFGVEKVLIFCGAASILSMFIITIFFKKYRNPE